MSQDMNPQRQSVVAPHPYPQLFVAATRCNGAASLRSCCNRAAECWLVQIEIPRLVPILIRALKDRSRRVRRTAVEALGWTGKEAEEAIPYLLDLLAGRSLREDAAFALAKIGCVNGEIISIMVDIANDQSRGEDRWGFSVRERAIGVLGEAGNAAWPAISALVSLLGAMPLAIEAHMALNTIGPAAIPEVLGALKDGDSMARGHAVCILASIGRAARAATPHLRRALRDPDSQVRAYATWALASLDTDDERSALALGRALEDEDAEVRQGACKALRDFGDTALPCVDRLTATLNDPNANVRHYAAIALATIDPTPSRTAALIDLLKDENRFVAMEAAEAVGDLGPAAAAAVPTLVDLLHHEDGGVRYACVQALRYVAPDSREIIGPVLAAMDDNYSMVRREAALTAGVVGTWDEPVLARLFAAYYDEHELVPSAAAGALGCLWRARPDRT